MEKGKKKPIIKNKLLEPYFIQISEYSYDVCKLTNQKGEKVSRALSYHSSVSIALKSIIDRKSKEFDGTIDLSDYIKKLEKLNNQILNIDCS